MYRFHISVHARPANVLSGLPLEFGGQQFATLAIEQHQLAAPLAVSFEEAFAALEQLPRMFAEMDGSFVWTSPGGEPGWQVDGVLYDRAGKLLFVDLKGACPAEQFDQLLTAIGWPATEMVFQLVRQALFLDEAEFRRFAEQAAP